MSLPSERPARFAARVIAWQRDHGRHDLPWQVHDPYRVWLSEVMLQQTQVATVLAYFDRFTARFPDVQALAAASVDDVLALWSGLGYYSRARNLHRAAQAIVNEHGGKFPRTSAALATLPGIGRSTAAAIAAFSFGERVAILDGNVKRVLARVLAFDGDLAQAGAERELWRAATGLLPSRGIETYTQGLMDLGATICLARRPSCLLCPVQTLCRAAMSGTQDRYPVKSRRLLRGRRDNAWLELRHCDRIWLVRREAKGIWAGLWSLPEFDSVAALDAAGAAWPGKGVALPSFIHVLTHLDWTLRPVRWNLPSRTPARVLTELESRWPSGRWFDLADALRLGLPAPLRKQLSADRRLNP
ncbi:MAG: A/G-specific adenine glycosylase [Caldimonas sp.]